MNVADLIHILSQHNPKAIVVLHDRGAGGDASVAKLGAGEVRAVDLGAVDENGVWVLELWSCNSGHDGPVPGVLLGDRL